jgi:hypothetical protein
VVLSDVLFIVNTRLMLIVANGGTITPFVPITPVLLEENILISYPEGTFGNVKLVSLITGAVTLAIPAATSAAVLMCAGIITLNMPVFAVLLSDVRVTVNTMFTLVAFSGGAITPFVPTTPGN